jgi:hypothetical protein
VTARPEPLLGLRVAAAFYRVQESLFFLPALIVVTALMRVLETLIGFVQEAGRPQHVPALRGQLQLLLAAVEQEPGLLPHDLDRLRAVAFEDAPDPADRSRHWYGGGPHPARGVAADPGAAG